MNRSGSPSGNSRTNLGSLAKELDVPPDMLYRFRREFFASQNGSFPDNGKLILTEREQELGRLKKELFETQMERDILKRLSTVRSAAFSSLNILRPGITE
ncbi:MAG: hypothetical protein ABIN24_12010 [Dyadobacter sp.]